MYEANFTMQPTSNDGNDSCAAADEYYLSHMMQRLVSYKVDSHDLVDFAHALTDSLTPELSNGNIIMDAGPPCYLNWQLCERLLPEDNAALDHSQNSVLTAGYTDCMDEAIRFLIEEEAMGPEHPLVRNLKAHLEESRERVLSTACEADVDNNNVSRTPCVPQAPSYDCYAPFNLIQSRILSNTG